MTDAVAYGRQSERRWIAVSEQPSRMFEAPVVEPSRAWLHVAVTYRDNEVRIYRNGVLMGRTAEFLSSTDVADRLFFVGRRHLAAGCEDCFLQGSIDDARLYSRALSAIEILSMYRHGQGQGGPSASACQ